MEQKNDKLFIKRILILALLALAVIYIKQILGLTVTVWGAIYPLLLGCIIAFVLNIVLKNLEKFYFPASKKTVVLKTRRPVCILFSFLIILGIIALIIKLIIPELGRAVSVIAQAVPIYAEQAKNWLIEHSSEFPAIADKLNTLQIDWENTFKSIISYATSGIGSLLGSTFSVVSILFGGLVDFVIALIFSVYLLVNKEHLFKNLQDIMQAYIKPVTRKKIMYVFQTANRTFSRFIVGQCTEALILGSLCTIGMFIFQFPYAPMIGAFIGATALIPIVGAYLGAALGAFMIFTINPLQALLFLVFLIVLQQLEGNLIYPKVVGSSIGLPGMWVLAAVTVGGSIAGIAGMLAGVPLAATGYKLLRDDVQARCSPQKSAAESQEK